MHHVRHFQCRADSSNIGLFQSVGDITHASSNPDKIPMQPVPRTRTTSAAFRVHPAKGYPSCSPWYSSPTPSSTTGRHQAASSSRAPPPPCRPSLTANRNTTKVIIMVAHVNTQATTSYIRTALSSLDHYIHGKCRLKHQEVQPAHR